jgi:glycosyltransferase involved in cell wall biosynthesis
MMPRPLVSIITPSLNQGDFLEACLKSVMTQSYEHLEHVVMDGGSTDSSLSILKGYEDAYPLRWQSRQDSGMYEAIDRGLREARGDIIAYINADDRYLPWAIEVVVKAVGRSVHERIMLFGDVVSVTQSTRGSAHGLLRLTPPLHPALLRLSASLVSQPGVFFSRQLLEDVGDFDETLRYVGDFDFFLRGLREARHIRLQEVLAVETEHHERKTTRDTGQLVDELGRVKQRFGASRGHRRAIARFYTFAARRVMFSCFLLAIARHRLGWKRGQWSRFITYADPTLSLRSLVLALLPGKWATYAGTTLRSQRPEWKRPNSSLE